MEVSASVKSQLVSVFQPNREVYEHWSDKRQCFVKVEHRGYVVDADDYQKAVAQLISMIRPADRNLSESMINTVNKMGVELT